MLRNILKLPLKWQLVLVVALPLFALSGLSLYRANAKYGEIQRLTRMKHEVRIHSDISAISPELVHWKLSSSLTGEGPMPPKLQKEVDRINQDISLSKVLPGKISFRWRALTNDQNTPLSFAHLQPFRSNSLMFPGRTFLNHTQTYRFAVLSRLKSFLEVRQVLRDGFPLEQYPQLKSLHKKSDYSIEAAYEYTLDFCASDYRRFSKVEKLPTRTAEQDARILPLIRETVEAYRANSEHLLASQIFQFKTKMWILLGVGILLPIMTLGLLIYLNRLLFTSLGAIKSMANQYAEGTVPGLLQLETIPELEPLISDCNVMQASMSRLLTELQNMQHSVAAGNLSFRGDESRFAGDWRLIIESLNLTLASFEDIQHQNEQESNRRSKEEQLLSSTRQQEALVRISSSLTHELNNLLTIILFNVEYLLDHAESSGNEEQLQDILNAVENSSCLVLRLMTLAGDKPGSQVLLPIRQGVGKFEKLIRPILAKNINLTCKAIDPNAKIHIEPNNFEQILLNLAFNSRQAMPEGGTISIDVQPVILSDNHILPDWVPAETIQNRSFWCVEFQDTGVGIPRDELHLVQEAFFSTRESSTNSGLGLSMVRRMMNSAGGWLDITSSVGIGTNVSLYFPSSAQLAPADRANVLDTIGKTILLIDDNEGIRKVTRSLLVQFGYTVIEAVDGVHALVQYENNRDTIDLIITDVIMPNMDGNRVASKIRETAGFPIPILFMSAHYGNPNLDDLMDFPNSFFIYKPFHVKSLIDLIENLTQAPVNKDG